MSALLAVLVLVAAEEPQKDKEKKDDDVSVGTVTVNGDGWQSYPPAAGEPPTTAHAHTASGPVFGQLWSVVTPRTVGQNANQLDVAIGFPGGYVSYLRGITPALDLGARIAVNYGYEGQVTSVQPGIKLQAQLKYRFFDNGKVSIGVNFAPGPLFYFPNGTTVAGATLPIGLNLGIVASSALNVGVTFEVPFWFRFGNGWGAVVPVLTGAGVEYFVSSALAVWAALRMGPSLWTNGLPATFTLDARAGIGWRF